MSIEHTFPSSPIAVFQKIAFLLQKWGILLRDKDREKLDKARSDLEGWAKLFVANTRRSESHESVFVFLVVGVC